MVALDGQARSARRRRWIGASVLAALAAMATLGWNGWIRPGNQAPQQAGGPNASMDSIAVPTGSSGGVFAVSAEAGRANVPAAPGAAAPAAEPSSGSPPGLTPQQLSELRASLENHPQREAEVERIAAYMQFAQQWTQFRERRAAGAAVSELQPLASALDGALEERLRQREMSAAEALQVKAALLEALVPDVASRQTALSTWRSAALAGAPPAAAAPQDEAFQRRQAEIVAAWRALPPEQRDERRLEAELDALRSVAFPAPAAAPASRP